MRVLLATAIRFIAVSILYFVCFVVVSGALLSTPAEQRAPAEAGATLAALLIVSLINGAVWTYVIRRSYWTGWKLIVTVLLVFYGVTTAMPQIETAYFITRLPPGMLPRLFLAGIIIAAVFAPLAVLILGKARTRANETPHDARLNMPLGSWVAKLSLIVVAYILIYFTFGYFIAWKSRSSARLLQRRRSRQLLHAHGKRATHRATPISLTSGASIVVGRHRRAGDKDDEGRVVGSRLCCRTLVCRNDCAVVATKSTHAG